MNVFRSNLVLYGFVLNVFTLILFSFNGLFDYDSIKLTLYFLIIMIIGTVIGMVLARRINEDLFKKVVIVLLILSSLWITINGIRKLLESS